ncbi:MAG TPA: LysM peptidoglycan-binding domain-containing protein, partial [Anaerolineales bacterium]|nr:LysM peptidoglycan-binding domain-containing protein [Anaerolineales bacterium]
IKYGTTINSIRALNHLSDTTVYEGQVLLIQKSATQPPPVTATVPQSLTSTPEATRSPTATQPFTSSTATSQSTVESTSTDSSNGSASTLVMSVFLLVIILGSATVVWFIRTPGDTKDRR